MNKSLPFKLVFALFFFILIAAFSNTKIYANPGEALDFDGVDDVIIVPDAPSQGVGTNFTLETWFKSEGTISAYRALLDKRNTANNHTNFSMAVFNGMHATIFINHGGGDFLFYQTNNVFIPGNWYHYAVTYDGNLLRQYVNGIIIREESVVITNPQLNVPIHIGRAAFNGEHFDGQIDEVRIWNLALTQSEIQARMSYALVGTEAGLIAYYDFNQGVAGGNNVTETTLLDRSGNGNNGTLTNFALVGNSSNWVAPGAPLLPPPIPTLGQWGLILLSMLMLLFVTITAQFRETSRQKMLSKIKAEQSSILRLWLALSIVYLALIAPLFVYFEIATLWDLPFGIIVSLIVSIWRQLVKMSTQNQKLQTAVG